jgi:hypothetical protein
VNTAPFAHANHGNDQLLLGFALSVLIGCFHDVRMNYVRKFI